HSANNNGAHSDSQAPPTVNTLLWIGGLFDTLAHVRYPFTLASGLPPPWTLAQLSLSSAGRAWGVSSLDSDVADLANAIAYFRGLRPGGRIVLMGHSTGCQDALHYLSSASAGNDRPMVDGIILQAPVSDREALVNQIGAEAVERANAAALAMREQGREGDCIPMALLKPLQWDLGITASRWLSLASLGGEDDMFSSDLKDTRLEETFGRIPKNMHVLLLSSGADEYVSKHVDVPAMLKRWAGFAERAGARVHKSSTNQVPGATHDLATVPDSVVRELIDRVVGFL
ncbi:DUF1749-domain-containing protein, partial [Myriangium duriaei CBS 260.36]